MKNTPFIEGNVIYLDRYKAYKQNDAEVGALRQVIVDKMNEISGGMEALMEYKEAIAQFTELHNQIAMQVQEISNEAELIDKIYEDKTGESFLKAVQSGKYKELFPEEDDDFDDDFPS